MKHRFLFILVALTILTFALLSCTGTGEPVETEPGNQIKVSLLYPSDYVAALEDSVYITPGEDAVFTVMIAPGYLFVPDEEFNVTLENNKLTISGLRYPTTYEIKVEKDLTTQPPVTTLPPLGEPMQFYYEAGEGGKVTSTLPIGKHPSGSSVSLSATVTKSDYTFIGWSKNGYLTKGGTLVSTDSVYSFQLGEAHTYYANFKHKDEAIICYHLNGGTVAATGADTYYSTFPIDYYYYPNAVADLDIFRRDGYTILEYSTNPDGSGFVTCPGGKVFLDGREGIIHLYVQWSKWSNESLFQYESVTGGVAITGYTGSESTVSIPAKIGGKSVITIKAGAFNDTPMETLVIPKTVKTIEDGAFVSCSKIDTLYMFDTIQNITDNCFKSSRRFTNFRFNAAVAPVHSDIWGAYSRKWERIVYHAGSAYDLLIILSGSSSLYATDSPLLESSLAAAGYDFTVCNFGIQAGIMQYVYLDFMEDFLDSGDIIIQAPEPNSGQNSIAFTKTLISAFESINNVFRYLDASQYNDLFSAIASFNAERAGMKPMDYSAHRREGFDTNIYGDWEKFNKDGVWNSTGSIKMNGGTINSAAITRYNDMYKAYSAKGVRIYFSIPAMHKSSFKATAEQAAAYEATIDNQLLAPRISSIADYILDDRYFYNSAYHTNGDGAVLRTTQLIEDLLTQFAKEGS